MTEAIWIHAHVERLLRARQGGGEVPIDRDGDFLLRFGTSVGWVSVLDAPAPMVRVLAHAAYGLTSSAKLLRELNELNLHAVSASVYLVDDIVAVQQTVSPIGLSEPVLAQAVNAVGCIADDIGGLLAAMFDGTTPLRPRPVLGTVDEEAS